MFRMYYFSHRMISMLFSPSCENCIFTYMSFTFVHITCLCHYSTSFSTKGVYLIILVVKKIQHDLDVSWTCNCYGRLTFWFLVKLFFGSID